jgi:hypothetical protein
VKMVALQSSATAHACEEILPVATTNH